MESPVLRLGEGRWGLARARAEARQIEASPKSVRALLASLLGEDAEVRKRAADVARRVTERDATALWSHAEELAGVLAGVDVLEARTRWHLGLVVARVAHTREQRLRAGRLMQLLAGAASNVARCSAIEGMAVLAAEESSLCEPAAALVERALRTGTKAERCRARDARARLLRAGAWMGEDVGA